MGRRQHGHVHEEFPGSIRPAPARPHADPVRGADAARGAPLSAGAIAHLQRTAGNRAVGHLVAQRALVVQRDSYPFGAANTIPHIHKYKGGAHIKILDGGKIKRIDLVQDGKRYGDNVARAFDLARATGDTVLVNAIKGVIAGTPFA